MPDYPPEAVEHGADAIAEMFPGLGLVTARTITRLVLDAAAQSLGDHAARKILAHMETHGPQPPAGEFLVLSRWHRHFRIAAHAAEWDSREQSGFYVLRQWIGHR